MNNCQSTHWCFWAASLIWPRSYSLALILGTRSREIPAVPCVSLTIRKEIYSFSLRHLHTYRELAWYVTDGGLSTRSFHTKGQSTQSCPIKPDVISWNMKLIKDNKRVSVGHFRTGGWKYVSDKLHCPKTNYNIFLTRPDVHTTNHTNPTNATTNTNILNANSHWSTKCHQGFRLIQQTPTNHWMLL